MPSPTGPEEIFRQTLAEHQAVIEALSDQRPVLERIAVAMAQAILSGGKVLWCGNGGSAADSQHMAAEFVGRFRRERGGLASMALTTDTSILTSVANDYGFEEVFRRQVEAHCAKGDILVGISTSGTSPNVCAALRAAREIGALTVAFTGAGGGIAGEIAELTLRVPSKNTARIQEAHILCGHMLCDWVDASVCEARALENESIAP